MRRHAKSFQIVQSLLLMISILSVLPQDANGQDNVNTPHYFLVGTYQWPYATRAEIFEVLEREQDLVDKNEHIISQKVLAHRWGEPYSAMIISEYASLADVQRAVERRAELMRELYPDEDELAERNRMFNALVGGNVHQDSILQEVPSLTK